MGLELSLVRALLFYTGIGQLGLFMLRLCWILGWPINNFLAVKIGLFVFSWFLQLWFKRWFFISVMHILQVFLHLDGKNVIYQVNLGHL